MAEPLTPASSRIRRASACWFTCGLTHTPDAGEPKPAQLSWVRIRCLSSRCDSGTDTSSTSHRSSHWTSSRPNA